MKQQFHLTFLCQYFNNNEKNSTSSVSIAYKPSLDGLGYFEFTWKNKKSFSNCRHITLQARTLNALYKDIFNHTEIQNHINMHNIDLKGHLHLSHYNNSGHCSYSESLAEITLTYDQDILLTTLSTRDYPCRKTLKLPDAFSTQSGQLFNRVFFGNALTRLPHSMVQMRYGDDFSDPYVTLLQSHPVALTHDIHIILKMKSTESNAHHTTLHAYKAHNAYQYYYEIKTKNNKRHLFDDIKDSQTFKKILSQLYTDPLFSLSLKTDYEDSITYRKFIDQNTEHLFATLEKHKKRLTTWMTRRNEDPINLHDVLHDHIHRLTQNTNIDPIQTITQNEHRANSLSSS